MIKLCENNKVLSILDGFLYSDNDKTLDKLYDISYNQIFNHEWIILDNYRNFIIPINKIIYDKFIKINEVQFEFEHIDKDTPITNDDVSYIDVPVTNILSIYRALILYCTYKLIDYLPYVDFGIDTMPTISNVYINGKKSNIFDDIVKYINDEFDHINAIYIYKNQRYKLSEDTEFIKDKNIKYRFTRINNSYPLFYYCYKPHNKAYRNIDHIEISLQWYNNKYRDNDMTEIANSDIISTADEYIYSYSNLSNTLTLLALYDYLISYYKNINGNLNGDNFLLYNMTVYFKSKVGLQGYQIIYSQASKYGHDIFYVFDCICDQYKLNN